MYRKKECVAMLLAGGQGSRLYVLTKMSPSLQCRSAANTALSTSRFPTASTPALTRSACSPSMSRTCSTPISVRARPGTLTACAAAYTSCRRTRKARPLSGTKGTANAIYQNIAFIDEYDPEYVLILSGDHIYKMNYNKMLQQHKETGADATIAVLDVPLSEASRFGIMNCKPDGTIYEFEEKPKQPKSTLASMGIYIFSWKKLRQYLIDDENNAKSSNDFGKDIIPAMLANGEKLVSYRFEGYWKDVGTIESLWEANMDLLSPNSGLNLSDDSWKIYGRTTGSPPHFTAKTATVKHTLLSEGCEIAGDVSESVLFSDVKIAKGAKVEYSILMPGAVVEEGATVRYAIVAENAVIAKDAEVGGSPADGDVDKWGVAVVAEGVRIGRNAKLAAKEMADEDLPDVK